MRRRRHPRGWASAALSVLLVGGMLFTAGCSSDDIPIVSSITHTHVFSVGGEKCTVEEAKIILLQYQKEYSSLYGIDLWEHDYGEEESLEQYVKDLTISQLAEVYTLDVIASEQGIELSDNEKEQAAAAASTYMEGLSENELNYLGIEEAESAEELFERFLLAQKLYTTITESVSQEVSDDEALVMEMEQICVSDEETAETLLEKLDAGSDFSSLAESYNESESTEIQVSRTSFSDDVIDILFALEEGTYSDIVEIDDTYCIFCCTNSFNEELTEANKENVINQRMEDAVTNTYDLYKGQLNSNFNENTWDEVSVDTGLALAGASFEEVFETYFGD